MVIAGTPGVACDPAAVFWRLSLIFGARGVVKFADTEHCDRGREDIARVLADLSAVIGEISHAGGEAATDPVEMAGMVSMRERRGEAGEFEAFFEGGIKECLRIDQHNVIIVPCGCCWLFG